MSVEPKDIEALRSSFLDYVSSKGESCVHPKDLNRAKTDDEWIRRFLLHHENDQAPALDMMKECIEWRKTHKVNDICPDNIRMDHMVEGAIFPRGRDKDGCALIVFKCIKHVKGTRDLEDIKRLVIYWMERLERDEEGKQITVFFDMEGCGLKNMDLEFTKYIIALFKQYYPYFLNYILIYEMSWVLNAALNIIKSLLPPKAVQKIQMIKKSSVFTFVPEEQALKCWGGKDDYVFSFVADAPDESLSAPSTNKKVHFAAEHGDQMTDSNLPWDKESTEGGALCITPSNYLTFVKDAQDFITTLEIKNVDAKTIYSYKLKTNAPQKFRVRPSTGLLQPGESANIIITLLPAYQVSGLSKDKFLVASVPVTNSRMTPNEMTELWRTVTENVTTHRLKCTQLNNGTSSNENVDPIGDTSSDNQQIAKLNASITQLHDCQVSLHKSMAFTHKLLVINILLLILIALGLIYLVRSFNAEDDLPSAEAGCYNQHTEEL